MSVLARPLPDGSGAPTVTALAGAGKTSSSISLAAGLARKNKKVLLIDIDSQANSSKVLLEDYLSIPSQEIIFTTIIDERPLPVRESQVPNLYVVPSHILLSETDIRPNSANDHREARLKRALDKIRDEYDYIFVDCPPSLSWLSLNAFTAADKVLIVVAPGYFDGDEHPLQ